MGTSSENAYLRGEKSHGKIFGTLQHLEGKEIILESGKRDCRVPKVEGQTFEYDILIAEVRRDFVSFFFFFFLKNL